MNKLRILYADNDLIHLEARCELLEGEGFEILKACSPPEVEQIMDRENFHLMILDIRLVDDDDEGDTSGLQIAKDERYRGIPKIIVTGYPTFEAVRDVYHPNTEGERVAYAFLSKKEGVDVLIDAIQSAEEEVIRIRWDLDIRWDEMGLLSPAYLVTLLEPELPELSASAHAEELNDLLRKLFFTDEQISVVRLNWLRNGCACLMVYAFKQGTSRQEIVILGPYESVKNQRDQVDELGKHELAVFPKKGFAETCHFAALAFSLPDTGYGPLMTGQEFFLSCTEKNLRFMLENLFEEKLFPLYPYAQASPVRVDLVEFYRERLGISAGRLSPEKIGQNLKHLLERAQMHSVLKSYSTKEKELSFILPNSRTYKGPDPVGAIFDSGTFGPALACSAWTFDGITSAGLLVDPDGIAYPMDIASIRQAHILVDLICLEAEFHFDWINSSNLITRWDFEKQLGEAKSFNGILSSANLEPECRKSLAAIQSIRKLASEAAGDCFTPYRIGLFFETMAPVLQYDPQRSLPKYQLVQLTHRLLAASLLLSQMNQPGRLESLHTPDPEREFGIKINEDRREVIVDCMEVKLTQTQFKLLLYLYKNANRLCRREEILAAVFDVRRVPDEDDKGLLTTHIDRLRRKIDLNVARHRYIVTIRGEGYMLDLQP